MLRAFNLGPWSSCVLCGLNLETPEHLFYLSNEAQVVWQHIYSLLGKTIAFSHGFTDGSWLLSANILGFCKVVCAAIAWYIWKARCDIIFRSVSPNFHVVSIRAFNFAKDYFCASSTLVGKKLLLNNFPSISGFFL